jgi:hypothetical protein
VYLSGLPAHRDVVLEEFLAAAVSHGGEAWAVDVEEVVAEETLAPTLKPNVWRFYSLQKTHKRAE